MANITSTGTPTAPNPNSILAYHAGQTLKVPMKAGHHYKVRRPARADDPANPEVPDNLIATRKGDDLHIRYADGGSITLENFYGICTDSTVCSVNLAGDTGSGMTLSADLASGASLPVDDGILVYAHGSHEALMVFTQGQPALGGALVALGNTGALSYLPPAAAIASTTSGVAIAASGFEVLPVLGGVAGLALVAGGLSGATATGSGTTPTLGSIVQGTIQAGPITSSNDLEVALFAADGTTLLKDHVVVDSNGHFSTEVGSYTGVVFARLVNKGGAADYLDEATNTGKDLSAPLMAMGVVSAPGVTLSLNLNVLTTLAANKAGANPSAATAEAVNSAVAKAFGLVSLQDTTVVPTNGGSYNAADGISEGEKYGALLAGFSGMDMLNGGDVGATIQQISDALTVTGTDGSTTATLTDTIKYNITAGAKVVAAASANQAVVTSDFGDAVATLINYEANPVTEGQGLTTIGNTAGGSTTTTSPTAFDYANANVTGVDSSAELQLINDVVTNKSTADVDSVAELQVLADAVAAVLAAAAGGTAPTLQQLQALGLQGVNSANLSAVLAAIANTADDGSAVDTQAELQALVNTIVNTAVSSISAYAEANIGTAPALGTYSSAGITGVDSSNLASINDVLTSTAITGAQTDTQTKIQAIVDAYQALFAEANGTTADATPGVNPTAAQYATLGVDMGAAATDLENLALLNSLLGAQSTIGVDTVAEISNLARIANAIQLTASGGTPSPALTAADLALTGLTGVTADNLSGVLQSIANQDDAGTGTDSLAELQTLINNANNALGVISAYAQGNTASAPATPTGTAPALSDYSDAGVTGVDSSNLGAINDALTSNAITGTQADTQAEVQAIVDAYSAILAEANGATADSTPGVNPTAAQYAAIGANIGAAASDAENLALLNDLVAAQSTTGVDTVAEINELARIANAIQLTAGGGTPSPALTATDLALIGLTGVTADNLSGVLQSITNQDNTGTATDSLPELQTLVNNLNSAVGVISAYAQANTASAPATPSGTPPVLSDYSNAGISGVSDGANGNLAAINDALATNAITGTQADTPAEIQALVNAYSAILSEANGATADATPGNNPTATQYAAIGADIGTAASDTEDLALLNDIIGAQSTSGVDTVAEINELARIANAIQLTATGGTPSPALTAADLALIGLTGVTADNLGGVLQSIANQDNTGSATDSLPELQTLVNNLNSAVGVINAYAQANTASAPTTPTGTAPVSSDYAQAGVTGVSDGANGNLAAINDALATASITGTQADTPAEIQALVDAYSAILAEANGATADATPGSNPTATQYATIGADIGTAATDTEDLALLNDIIGAQSTTGVDTVAEINNLARIANAIQLTASGGTPSPALTATDLALIGLTGVTADNLSGVLQSIANQDNTGTATDSLPELQTLVNNLNTAVTVISSYAQANIDSAPTTPVGTAPVLSDYVQAGVTGVTDGGSGNLAAINDALATASITGTQADTPAEIQALVDAYSAILTEANGATADATPGSNPTATQYAAIGASIGAAASDAENLALLNDIVGAQSTTGVDTVAEINNLARIANAIQLTASGGTPSPALTATDLALIGLTGVTAGNLSSVLSAIAAQDNSGTATDSLPELQTLVTTITTALGVISAYAQANTDSAPATPGGTAPVLIDFSDAGITGVSDGANGNFAAINDALATASITGTQADTPAEIQAIVDAYSAILASADGDAGTAATALTAAQFAAIGATIGSAGNDAENLGLLNDTIGSKAAAGVDTVAEINQLAAAVNAVANQAAGIGGLTMADLAALGITGVTDPNGAAGSITGLSAANIQNILNALSGTLNDGSEINTLAKIQALVNAAVDLTPPAAPSFNVVTGDDIINGTEQGAAISGTAEINSVITITLGGISHTVTTDGSGNWSYTLQPADISAMEQGPETLSITATDAAGNVSSSATRSISIDTLAPTLAVAAIAGDGILNQAEHGALDDAHRLLISGTTTGVEDGRTVTIELNNNQYTTTVTGNTWSLANLPTVDALALNHGNSYTATASVTDAAGNVSNVGSSAVLIDIATPDIPTVHQKVTNNTRPTLTGHAEKTLDAGTSYIKLQSSTSDILSVVVNGVTYTLTIGGTSTSNPASAASLTYNTTSGDWTLDLTGATNPMTNGFYEVDVSVTAGGLTKTDISTNELKINTDAVVVAMASITSDDMVNAAEAGGMVLLHGTSSNLDAGQTVDLTLVDGSIVHATVQPDGSWSIAVAGSTFNAEGAQAVTANATNAAGTAATPLVHSVTVDTVLPTATVVLSSSTLLAGQTAVVTITFNEAVTGFDNNDLTIPNGTLSAVSSSDGGITWTATFTPSSNLVDASNAITLDKTGVSDAAGNTGSGSSSSANFSVDTHRPSAAITLSDSALIAGETASVTLTFSEAVTGLTNADLSISNGLLSAVSSGDGGITWTATFTPTADFTAASNFITLDNSGVVNAAGNAGAGQTSSANYAIDTHVPVVMAVTDATADAITRDAITFTVTFDEVVASAVGLGNFSATNGTVTSVTTSDNIIYTVVVTPNANVASGSVALSLVASGLSDAAGNALANANLSGLGSQDIDTRAPSVSTVTDSSGAITKDAITFTVTFDEAVNGTIDLSSFSASNGSVTSVTTSDNIHYTVVVTPTAGLASGNVALTLIANGQTDATGNPILGADLSGQNSQAIDTLVPNAPPINLVAGDDVVNLAESVGTITGTCEAGATVALSLGGNTRTATVSGSTWSYTLQAADLTAMGQGPETLSATQTDAAGNVSTAGTRDISVDTLIDTPTVVLEHDTANGADNSDLLTRNAALTVSAAAGDVTRTYTVDGGAASASYVAPTAQGSHTVVVHDVDAAGNTSNASLTFTLDTVAPNASVTTATLQPSANASVQSSETGIAYLVASTVSVSSLADITGADGTLWNQATITTANSNSNLALTGLVAGSYKLYTVDAAGNVSSASANTVTVDNPPVNTVPGAQSLNEDGTLTVTGLSVADPDAGETLTVTLSALHGVVTVVDDVMGSGTNVTGSGSASVTLTGTVAEINATLAALGAVTYAPTSNYNGSDTLTLLSSDGKLSDTDTVAVTVNAVNDAPVLSSTAVTDAAALYVKASNVLITPTFTANSAASGGFGLTYTATKIGTASVLDATSYYVGAGASSGTLNLSFSAPVSKVTVSWQYQTNFGGNTEYITLAANGSPITPTLANLTQPVGSTISIAGNNFTIVGENSNVATYSYTAEGITSFSFANTITVGGPNGSYASIRVTTPGAGAALSSMAPSASDVDAASSVKGYAITSAAASGIYKWQYSTNGGTVWFDLSTASLSTAFYLASTDTVRWTGASGTQTALTMVAVDNTGAALHAANAAAGTLNVTTRGGTTAYSADIATLIGAPAMVLATDSGTFSNDGVTNVATVNVTGLASGATWEYSTDGGTTWNAGGGNSFSLLANSTHAYAVRQTDLGGNIYSSATKSYTLDTIVPAQTVAITTYTDNVGSGAAIGNFASGTSTDDTTPVLNGTLSATLLGTDFVRIYDGATLLGSATVSGTSWTFATPTLLDGSQHSYTAKLVDLAGNENTGSSAFALTVSSPYERLTNATLAGATNRTSLAGWTLHATDAISTEQNVEYYSLAVDPTWGTNGVYFNLGNTTAGGAASQTMSNLVVGQSYTVQYDLYINGNASNTHTLVTSVLDGSVWNAGTQLASQSYTQNTNAHTLHTFTFVAISSTATVVFTNTTVSNTTGSDLILWQASVMTTDEAARHAATPLVIDLNGDGVQTTTVDHGVLFDVANTGSLARTAWANASDGLLVRDVNHDGVINNGAELFGNGTLLADGRHAANGFDALAQFDANLDGTIDAQDAVFQELKIWRDANGDGVSQASELLGLQELGIASFHLSATANDTGDNGNLHGLVSSYTTTDGTVHALDDVWFQQGAQFTLDTDAAGWSTLHLASNTQGLDLSTVDTTRLQGVNVIDLQSNQTADTLRLDVQQVLDLGGVNWLNNLSSGLTGGSYLFAANESRHQLVVTGDAADQLTTTGGFVDTGLTAILNGHTYEVYNQGSYAQLLVEQSMQRTAVV